MSDVHSKRPDYYLKVKVRGPARTNDRGVVGSGWSNENGTINMSLNPGVVLDWHDDLILLVEPVRKLG